MELLPVLFRYIGKLVKIKVLKLIFYKVGKGIIFILRNDLPANRKADAVMLKVYRSLYRILFSIGFIYKNEDGNRPMGDYINTVRQVERITGIDFFPQLPDELEKRVEKQASLDDWR